MRIKALKTFVSGRYDASRGDIIELPDPIGQKLVTIGFAEAQEGQEKPAAPAANKGPAAPKKKAITGKSGAKTGVKK